MKKSKRIIQSILLFLCGLYRSPAQDMSRDPVPSHSFAHCYEAAVATDGMDLFGCTWSDRSDERGLIRAALYHRGENAAFARFILSDTTGHTVGSRPSIAAAGKGRFLIVWQQDRGETKRIIGRLVSEDGSMDTTVISISDSASAGFALSPSVAANMRGEILVAWQDYRNGNPDVYAQRFDPDGIRLGGNFRINDDSIRALQGVPTIARDCVDAFHLFWIDNRPDGKWAYYSRVIRPERAASNAMVDSVQPKDMSMIGRSVVLPSGTIRFVWKDYRDGNSNIFMKDLRKGSMRWPDRSMKINDDAGPRWQRLPDIGTDGLSRSLVCWEDYRQTDYNQAGDIYAQLLSASGKRRGRNFRINDGTDRRTRRNPLVAMSRSGGALVVWHQLERGAIHIYGQWFDYPQRRRGSNFIIGVPGEG